MEDPPLEPANEPVAVDASLIDEMLRLSPAERLRQNDRMAALAVRLQELILEETRRKSRG